MKIRKALPFVIAALLASCNGPAEFEECDSLDINQNSIWANPIWGEQMFYEIYMTVEPWRAVRDPQLYFTLRDTVDGHVLDTRSSPVYWDSTFWIFAGEVGGKIVKEFPGPGVYHIATAVQFKYPLAIDEYHRPSSKQLGINVEVKVAR